MGEVKGMPGKGYTTITIPKQIYDKWHKRYEDQKEELYEKGVRSFSAYISTMLEELMERNEVFRRHAPFIQKLFIEPDAIYLKDNKLKRTAIIVLRGEELFCELCERTDCAHVGYAYSLPELYKILVEKGVKLPEIKP
jgi:hypothetical protein